MNKHFSFPRAALAASWLIAGTVAQAHVVLDQKQAAAGGAHTAVFRVGHGCDGSPTTALVVQLPAGFANAKPQPVPGWKVDSKPGEVRWTAASREAALPEGNRGGFALAGTLPAAPGALWFKVLQNCEKGSKHWAEIPASGTSTKDMKLPAALLEVLDAKAYAAATMVQVEGAWIRPTVPGQMGTGGFMTLTAKQPLQIVGASSPAAGVTEVHEMKMEGDTMKMRAVPSLALPAGKAVELSPGGSHHLMLMDLKQPLAKGSTVPLTLMLRDDKGAQSKLELQVPVDARAPQAANSGHKH